MQIKALDRQGVPRAQIARRLGVSRQTVYNHLNRASSAPRSRKRRPSKLDPYRDYVRARLEEFNLPATVLYREIRAMGYEGKLTILRDFVRPLKKELAQRVVERFETRPGHQAQLDWAECGHLTVGGERRRLYLFTLVLGYSRMMYARFTISSRIPALLDCLQRAFQALGVPGEILVDNMKQVVDQHDVATGTVRWNRTFLAFAEHHGFLPAASPPYWPQVKGKVERGIGYVKASFLEGRSVAGLEDLNTQLAGWLEAVANVRTHGTTGERPVDRHARERSHLTPLASIPHYDTRPVELRVVHRDSHIRYRAVDYSVHPEAVGHTVAVRPEGEAVGAWFSVFLGDERVARHRRRPKGTGRVTLARHREEIRTRTRGNGETAQRRHGRQPRFVQTARPEEAAATLDRIHRSAPSVDVHPLDVYEQVARRAVR